MTDEKENTLKRKYNFTYEKNTVSTKFKLDKNENRKLYLEYLNNKSYQSQLSQEEIADVMMELQKFLNNDPLCDHTELWSLIETLSFVGSFSGLKPEYITLLEKFLDYHQDLDGPLYALSILCINWDLTSQYAEKIKSFLKGVAWDSGIVKRKAIYIAVDLIQEAHDKECLQFLITILENKQEGTFNREIAFKCICKSIGIDWDDIPEIDPDHLRDTDKEIIEKARQIYGA